MGLDAMVFCDCFEKGRLRTPPPFGLRLKVHEDGCIEYDDPNFRTDGPEIFVWDQWVALEACEHQGMILCHRRLNNIAGNAMVREQLSHFPERFPILLEKVVYSGTHGGDWLTIEEVRAMVPEVEAIKSTRVVLPPPTSLREWLGRRKLRGRYRRVLDKFQCDMNDVVAAALSVNKPILF